MTYSLSLLEKWAYIMVILVCFTILLTFFSYLFCFFMILRRKLLSNRQTQVEDYQLDYLDMVCCNSADTNRLVNNSEHYMKNLTAQENSKSDLIETSKKNPVKLKQITQQQQTIPILRKFSLANMPLANDANHVASEITIDTNFVPKFLTNFKEMFKSFSGNSNSNQSQSVTAGSSAANTDDLSQIKTVVIPARLNSSNSSGSSDEELNKTIKKSSFRRTSTIKLNRKSRTLRNSSLPPARTHTVKFNPNTKMGSGDEESCTSDEYPGSLITHKKSVSSQDSRKNSSGSSYYQSSIVDIYKQQRLSNGSIFTTTSDVRKLSINQINPFESFGVKLVTMEPQEKLATGYLNTDRPRKASAYSVITPGSKMDALTMRRFSIMTPEDVTDKFWVPPQIAAKKQRSSLPDTTTVGFKQQNETVFNLNSSSNAFYFSFSAKIF